MMASDPLIFLDIDQYDYGQCCRAGVNEGSTGLMSRFGFAGSS